MLIDKDLRLSISGCFWLFYASKYNNVNFSPTRTLIVFSCVFPGNAYVLTCTIPKWVLSPPKDGWKQFPPDINWKGAELDTAYMKKMDIAIPE